MRPALFAAAFFALISAARAEAPVDPFLWLEDVDSPKAMDWVRAENARTLGILEADPHYAGLHADALKIAEAKDRIPLPRVHGGQVYNFWQDAGHVHGIWRHVGLEGYRAAEPAWTTALDLDALSKAESANWFWHGVDCLEPKETTCLVSLSDGGEDAVTTREFDLETGHFVDGGFTLPHGKQSSTWIDADQLLVAREWTKGEVTTAGYPYVVKLLKRGTPLGGAVEVFRGRPEDTGVDVETLDDGAGNRAVIIDREISFFEHEIDLVTGAKPGKLALPAKVSVEALVAGRLVIRLDEDWAKFPKGALVALDLAALRADPAHPKPTLVFAPNPKQSVESVAATKDALLVGILDDVKGRALVFTPAANGAWTDKTLPFPDNLALQVVDADLHSDRAFVTAAGFLTPSTLYEVSTAGGDPVPVKSLPAKFDTAGLKVDQWEATSKDGTKIPYFIVHPSVMKTDGSNPTILYAYGGFQVSLTPLYSANLGKLWLEHGGTFVQANIRGGGEFGPAWHEAGLKTHRQRVYDDFAAVARDLIARGVTSPRRLGIEGGSNGGLLMGVEMTQHPELWNAVDIQVPLLDMLRFEKIAAGSSWVGEYGSVANPAERDFLASISPYAQLKPDVTYPEALIWTTTKDDRVGPQHARKFAARLQAMGKPYLYYEVIEGGHGSGANLAEKAHTNALEFTYFTRKLMDEPR